MLYYYYSVLISAALLAAVVAFVWSYLKNPYLSALNLRVLSVKIRKRDQKEGNPDFLKDINLSEQLFNSLSSIKKPFVFEIAVHNQSEQIRFYLAVPRDYLDFAKRQIQGMFLDAEVEEAPEYTVFNREGESAAAYLALAENRALPLRSYREAEADTFAPILSTLSTLKEDGDGAAVQIVVFPAPESVKKEISKSIEMIKKGEKLKDVLSSSFFKWKDFEQAFFSAKSEDKDPMKPKVVDEEAIKTLQLKISKPLYSVNVRIVTSSNEPGRAEEILLSVAGAFSQFTAALRNSFKVVKPSKRKLKKFIFQYVFRDFDWDQALTLNSEELASIIHMPTFSTEVPRIDWLTTKEAPPPANLPEAGVTLGASDFRGDKKLVRLADADRRRHLYTIGQTGVGKSYMMLNMAVQDMKDGKGLCVIDPHGSLIDDVLARVPAERIDDVIVFDPGDLRRPMGLNMLEYNFDRPEEKTFIVNEMINIMDKLYDLRATGGPMFELYMRNTLLLLMEDAKTEPATLMEIPRVFTDVEYRQRKLERINNPVVYDFWTKEAVKTSGEQGLANMAPYVTSKFNNFIANDYMRPIIGQTKSAFNFREAMDSGKILLVNLSKGRIGDLNANLLGMVFVGRILMAALSRVDIDESARKDFYLYIDEFQNFTTDSISVILSEARKYKLSLIIAHQFIAQLKDEIRESVFGNVGSMVAFRVGDKDAEHLVKQFGPEFSERDLTSVENQKAFAKLLIDGQPARPFSFKTLRAEAGSPEVKEKLKELSRLTYGRDLAQIEQEIMDRLRK